MNQTVKLVARNMAYAFVAQGTSLTLSILMLLILPKFLGVEDFAYWQLFIFYVTYLGIFHFGLNEGIYLRIGGQVYEELDYSLVGTQWKIAMVIQSIIGLIIIAVAATGAGGFIENSDRQFVIMCVGVYLVLINANRYLGYIFQAVNRTTIHSKCIIFEKVVFMIIMVAFLIIKVDTYQYFIVLYTFSILFGLFYNMIKGKEIVLSKLTNIKTALKEMYVNCTVGVKLLLASIVSLLIIGNTRFIVDRIWGIVAFSKFSFALNVTNFFLTFIGQVSMVLFPAFRRISEEQLNRIYVFMRSLLGLFLPCIFFFYIPLKVVLGSWLPQYAESLKYLALILPICTFDGKMQMLCNTYFKVLRKEKPLLIVNIATMVLSLLLGLFAGYVLNNIYAIVIFTVFSIAFRSIISELYLAKLMGSSFAKNMIQECILAVTFMLCSWFLSDKMSFIVFGTIYVLYLIINWREVKTVVQSVKAIISNKG